MKTLSKRISLLILLSALIFFVNVLVVPIDVYAIGISGGPIVINEAANGIRFSKRVKIIRTNEKQPSTYQVIASGEVAKYVLIEEPILVFAPGELAKEYDIIIQAKSAPNGVYKGLIQFKGYDAAVSSGKAGSNLSVNYSVAVTVSVQVVDRQIKSYEISNVNFEPIEEQSPVIFDFNVKNTGNVDIRPDRIDLTFVDKTDEAKVIRLSVAGQKIKSVSPGVSEVVVVQTDADLPKGQYYADIDIIIDAKSVFNISKRFVEVVPAGTLAQSFSFLDFKTNNTEFNLGSPIKYIASISNTGSVSVPSILFVEITKDGEAIDILRSESKFVKRNEVAHFSVNNKLEKIGEYKAEAYVEYGSKQTDKKTVTFNVVKGKSSNTGFGLVSSVVAVIAVALAILIGLIILVIYKKRRKIKKEVSVPGKKKKTVHKSKK